MPLADGNFYRTMHVMHIAIGSRPSVCPCVTFMYRGRIGWVSSKVITRIISLGPSFLGIPTKVKQSKGNNPQNLSEIGVGSLFSAENLQYL